MNNGGGMKNGQFTVTIEGTTPTGEVVHQKYENVTGLAAGIKQENMADGMPVQTAVLGNVKEAVTAAAVILIDLKRMGVLPAALALAQLLEGKESEEGSSPLDDRVPTDPVEDALRRLGMGRGGRA